MDGAWGQIKLLASSRSAGKKMSFKGQEHVIEELTENSFGDVDIALFSAGGGQSKKCVQRSGAGEGARCVLPERQPEALDSNA